TSVSCTPCPGNVDDHTHRGCSLRFPPDLAGLRCRAKTPIVLTRNSCSESRTEPVSATPRGERTIVTSILLASDQRVKSSGTTLPVYSGAVEQIVFASGNRFFRNLSKSAGGSVTTSPLSSF